MTTTTMDTGVTAAGWAHAIIAALHHDNHGIWTLDADTVRNLNEADAVVRHWAGIVEPATGAAVSIQLSHREHRVSLSASYPKGWEPWINGRGRVHAESITVSDSKTPAQVAKDLHARLLTKSGYYVNLATALATQVTADAAHAKAAAIAQDLRAVLGAEVPHGWKAEPTRENHLQIEHTRGWSRIHVEGRVSSSDFEIDLTLSNLTADEARAILAIVTAGGPRKEVE